MKQVRRSSERREPMRGSKGSEGLDAEQHQCRRPPEPHERSEPENPPPRTSRTPEPPEPRGPRGASVRVAVPVPGLDLLTYRVPGRLGAARAARVSWCRSARARSRASSSARRTPPGPIADGRHQADQATFSTRTRSSPRTSSNSRAGRRNTTRPAPGETIVAALPPMTRGTRADAHKTGARRDDHGGRPGSARQRRRGPVRRNSARRSASWPAPPAASPHPSWRRAADRRPTRWRAWRATDSCASAHERVDRDPFESAALAATEPPRRSGADGRAGVRGRGGCGPLAAAGEFRVALAARRDGQRQDRGVPARSPPRSAAPAAAC